MAINQLKGLVTVVWGAVTVANLTEGESISYDIGESGDTVSSLNDVVHISKSSSAIVSTITITLPKGSPEVTLIDAQRLTRIPSPLIVRDEGMGESLGMASANCTQVARSSTTGDNGVETVSYSFKGNLTRVEL